MPACTCTIVHTCELGLSFMAHYSYLNRFVASTGALLHHGGTNRLNKNVTIGQVS